MRWQGFGISNSALRPDAEPFCVAAVAGSSFGVADINVRVDLQLIANNKHAVRFLLKSPTYSGIGNLQSRWLCSRRPRMVGISYFGQLCRRPVQERRIRPLFCELAVCDTCCIDHLSWIHVVHWFQIVTSSEVKSRCDGPRSL